MRNLPARAAALFAALALMLVSAGLVPRRGFRGGPPAFFRRQLCRDRGRHRRGGAKRRSPRRRDRAGSRRWPAALLFRTPKLFIKEKSEALREVATGQAVSGPPAGLKPVRVNNRIRRAIEWAHGRPDAARARSGESGSRRRNRCSSPATPPLLPTVRTALERETRAAHQARPDGSQRRARLRLDRPARARPPAAAGVIADRADGDAQALLRSLPTDAPERLRAAAQRGIDDIEKRRRSCAPSRMCSTASRSARCCCLPPSGLPSRSG